MNDSFDKNGNALAFPTTLACFAAAVCGAHPAHAQTYTVPDGSTFSAAGLPSSPADGTVIELQGNAGNDRLVTLPTGASGLTINGAAAQSVIDLGGGGRFSNFTSSSVTLNFGGGSLLFTGGTQGVFYSGGSLTVNGTLFADANASGSNGSVLFAGAGDVTVANGVNLTNNTTTAGAAIYANLGAVSLATESGDAVLSGNTSRGYGGAIRAGSAVTVGNAGGVTTIANNRSGFNSDGTASDTTGTRSGGAIESNSTVTLTGRTVTLSGNQAVGPGGGIYAGGAVTIDGALIADGNASLLDTGGAIYQLGGADVVAADGVQLTNNTAGSHAGGIWTNAGNVFLATRSGDAALSGNRAGLSGSGSGGAVLAGYALIGNDGGIVDIRNNAANGSGGAVYSFFGTLLDGSTVALSGNRAAGSGGAIYASNGSTASPFGAVVVGSAHSVVTIDDNLAGTTANSAGGAIYSLTSTAINGSSITLSGNQAVNAPSQNLGGAIYAGGDIAIGNADGSTGSIVIENNRAGFGSADTPVAVNSYGGALVGIGAVTLDADSIALSGNQSAGAAGGIYAGGALTVDGGLTVADNTAVAGRGGVIYANGAMTVSGSASVTDNRAGLQGGAFWVGGSATLNAVGGDITFSGNTQNTAGAVQANAIYLDNTGGTAVATLAASAGRTIAFYDPIQSNAANGPVSVIATGGGTVVFDGSPYVDQADRWSQIGGATEVQDGTSMVVRRDAVYGVTAADVGLASPTAVTVDGALTVATGGRVIADVVRVDAGSGSGVVNIGAVQGSAAVAPGMLDTPNVDLGPQGSLVFNHTGGDYPFAPAITGAGDVHQLAGTTVLTAANTYGGRTDVGGGVLRAGAAGTFSADSAVTVAAGGTLDLNGLNQTVAALTNAGAVDMGSAPATVLTVAGDYTGANGVIRVNTVLGDSSSATDLLHVRGDTAGSSFLSIANAGGAGALTSGDGIEVVQVDGASNGTFAAANRVEAGAYEYLLYKGGVDENADNGNWYLRSFFREADAPCGGGGAGSNGDCNDSGPDRGVIAWRPGVPGYVITPALNLAYGFDVLGTLHGRVGDVPGAVVPDRASRDGVWARIGGGSRRIDALDRFSADSRSFHAQFGKDWTLDQPAAGGSTHAGATLTFGSASADFGDAGRRDAGLDPHTGTVATQAQSVGGYWTRYLADGSYLDSVGQITHYHNRYGDIDGNRPGQDGFGVALSQEVGKPFRIAGSPFAIEPQAQLMYQYLSLGRFSDTVSDVFGTHTNALRARIGFRVFRFGLASADTKQTAIPWLSANLVHDFLPAGQTVVGETALTPSLARTWYDVGVGVTAMLGQRSALYANVRYAHSVRGQHGDALYGQVGYRYSW